MSDYRTGGLGPIPDPGWAHILLFFSLSFLAFYAELLHPQILAIWNTKNIFTPLRFILNYAQNVGVGVNVALLKDN